jgi:hypothetical protein
MRKAMTPKVTREERIPESFPIFTSTSTPQGLGFGIYFPSVLVEFKLCL